MKDAGDGRIVMINSMSAVRVRDRFGAYTASKAALAAATKTLAVELGPHGIRVNAVHPGYIWGDSVEAYFRHQADRRGITFEQRYDEVAGETALRYLPHSSEIAGTVLFLASDLAKPVTGQAIHVNCGHWFGHVVSGTRGWRRAGGAPADTFDPCLHASWRIGLRTEALPDAPAHRPREAAPGSVDRGVPRPLAGPRPDDRRRARLPAHDPALRAAPSRHRRLPQRRHVRRRRRPALRRHGRLRRLPRGTGVRRQGPARRGHPARHGPPRRPVHRAPRGRSSSEGTGRARHRRGVGHRRRDCRLCCWIAERPSSPPTSPPARASSAST